MRTASREPSATVRPPCRSRIREARCAARPISWVTRITVVRRSLWSRQSVSKYSRRWRGSSPAVGSSRSQTSASCARARARKTRRRSPPESEAASRSASPSTSHARIASSARRRSSGVSATKPRPWGARPCRTRSSERIGKTRSTLCGTYATARAVSRRGMESSGRPSKRISPPEDGSTRASTLSRVDLPEPFSPSTATTSPAATSASSPRSAGALPYLASRPRAEIFALTDSSEAATRRRALRSPP